MARKKNNNNNNKKLLIGGGIALAALAFLATRRTQSAAPQQYVPNNTGGTSKAKVDWGTLFKELATTAANLYKDYKENKVSGIGCPGGGCQPYGRPYCGTNPGSPVKVMN